jgi:hypothetical protein
MFPVLRERDVLIFHPINLSPSRFSAPGQYRDRWLPSSRRVRWGGLTIVDALVVHCAGKEVTV